MSAPRSFRRRGFPLYLPEEPARCWGRRLSSTAQLSLLLTQVWSLGRTLSGSSRLQIVTSISFGKSSVSKVSWVPHWAQNARVPLRVDLKRVGAPAVKRN